jgi:hypothetical protein
VLTANRRCHYLRKALLYPVVFINIYCVIGSVVELFLPSEESHQIFASLMLIICFTEGALQLFVLIFSGKKFLILITYAEDNFFMNGKPLTNTDLSVVRSYVKTGNKLTAFIYSVFILTLSTIYIELLPTLRISTENNDNQVYGQVIGRRKTVLKVWTPFQNLDSPYLKLDIIYEITSVSIFFLIFTAINMLTIVLILFFTAHFNLLAERIESHTKTIEKTTSTGTETISKLLFNISVK